MGFCYFDLTKLPVPACSVALPFFGISSHCSPYAVVFILVLSFLTFHSRSLGMHAFY